MMKINNDRHMEPGAIIGEGDRKRLTFLIIIMIIIIIIIIIIIVT